jgi:hypothetical protein
MQTQRIELFLVVGLLSLRWADGFSVLPVTTHHDGRRARVQCSRSSRYYRPELQATVAADSTPPPGKKEKITKEAQELLDVLKAKESGDPNRPELIVAQVAPSVR